MSKNLYSILGVDPSATEATLRHAYCACVRNFHPDHNHNADAASRLGEVIYAYRVLSEPQTRAAYDHGLRPQSAEVRGYDVSYDLVVSAQEARNGTQSSLQFWTPQGQPYEIAVPIPAGTRHGKRLTIRGSGGPSRNGSARGDLIVTIQVR